MTTIQLINRAVKLWGSRAQFDYEHGNLLLKISGWGDFYIGREGDEIVVFFNSIGDLCFSESPSANYVKALLLGKKRNEQGEME